MRRGPTQESLFPPAAPPTTPATAAALPARIRFGSSSWVYPGWRGTVYRDDYGSEAAFRRDCLAEYGRWPWFRAVGLDASFYAPMRPQTLARMASLLPPSIRWVCKVWEVVTLPRFPRYERYGAASGTENPRFLRADALEEALAPFGPVADRVAAHLLELPALDGLSDRALPAFVDRLDGFLAALPVGVPFALELRERRLVAPAFYALLRRHGVAPCLNAWERMPPLSAQARAAAQADALAAGPLLLRLLTVPGLPYTASVERFAPFDRLQEPAPEVRADAVDVALQALAAGAEVTVLVNNRLEGHAPATIEALGRAILARLPPDGSAP